jgi:hypothetical protein
MACCALALRSVRSLSLPVHMQMKGAKGMRKERRNRNGEAGLDETDRSFMTRAERSQIRMRAQHTGGR